MDSWMTPTSFIRVRSKLSRIRDNHKLKKISEKVFNQAGNPASGSPILFFNTSTRLEQVSQNAAFSLLSAWSLALDGHPVRFFTCHAGLTRCLLGTNPEQPDRKPPCASCYAQSRKMYQVPWVIPFLFSPD